MILRNFNLNILNENAKKNLMYLTFLFVLFHRNNSSNIFDIEGFAYFI